ncbi:hypothetical protein [Evansella cellulosilytica]|uniref:hypothetical protein n=1 Tax=Evansella cellulosilytica TaxID=1413 RepID=UPI0001C282D0|nr:hypothetical protein [Evansella cellulosilytica]
MSNGQLDGRGKIVDIEPFKLITYHWNDVDDDLAPSLITYKLEQTMAAKRLVKPTLTHENLLGRNTNYWPIVISDFKSFIETGHSIFTNYYF